MTCVSNPNSRELPVNQILQGSCLELLPTLPSTSIDLVVTDPPYLVRYRDRSGRTIRNDDNARVLEAFGDIYRVLKPDSCKRPVIPS